MSRVFREGALLYSTRKSFALLPVANEIGRDSPSRMKVRVVCLAKTHYLVDAFPHTSSGVSRLLK
jgi:hypothetical protein